jgi:hypothetical protein
VKYLKISLRQNNVLVILNLENMYKNSSIKIIPRIVVGVITICLFFYDKSIAGIFIFSAIIIYALVDQVMRKRNKIES